MYRRQTLGAAGAGALGLTAGCLDLILGEESTFEATEARVEEDVADEQGYSHVETHEVGESEEFAGHRVEVTNYAAEYERALSPEGMEDVADVSAETAAFGIFTSPEVSVAGRDFNPLDDMSTREIAEHVQDEYDDLEIGDEPVADRTVDSLGESVDIDTYEGSASAEGQEMDVYIDVGQFRHGDDHVVVTAVYPDTSIEELGFSPDSERDRITALVEAIEHDG